MICGFRHVGIVVQNLQKVCDFYVSLGFKIKSRANEKGQFIEKVTGIDKVNINWVKLGLEDGILLELIEYLHPEPKKDTAKQMSDRLGVSHMALDVKEIDDFCDFIVNLGGSIVNPPMLNENRSHKVAYCHDIEGNLFEIVETQ